MLEMTNICQKVVQACKLESPCKYLSLRQTVSVCRAYKLQTCLLYPIQTLIIVCLPWLLWVMAAPASLLASYQLFYFPLSLSLPPSLSLSFCPLTLSSQFRLSSRSLDDFYVYERPFSQLPGM